MRNKLVFFGFLRIKITGNGVGFEKYLAVY